MKRLSKVSAGKPTARSMFLALGFASAFLHAAANTLLHGPIDAADDPLGASAPAFWLVWWPALPHYARIFRYGRYLSVFLASAALNVASVGILLRFGIMYALVVFGCSVGLLFLGFHLNEKGRARLRHPGQN